MKKKPKPGIKDSLSLLLDFCNIEAWKTENLLQLYQKHRLGHSGDFGIGWQWICRTRLDDKRAYFLTEDDIAMDLHKKHPETYILPSQPDHRILWDLLPISQKRYRQFLDNCISSNELDKSFIMGVIAALEKVKWTAQEDPDDKWGVHISYDSHYGIIETDIDVSIAQVLFSRQGEIFSLINKCWQCKGHFIQKPKNKKYCSAKCRYDHHNKERVKSGKAAETMRRLRREKPEKYV